MEILGKLGIDIKLLIAQIINFGLLLWLLEKFLYAPIIKRIEKDENELNEAKAQKEELEKDKKQFQDQKIKEIAEARKKAEDIVAEAETISKQIKERSNREAEEEKEKIILQIRARLKDIENEQNQSHK